jgi:hypothetical protein
MSQWRLVNAICVDGTIGTHRFIEAPKMIIYKVTNDKDSTIVEYYLNHDQALQSAKDMMEWYTEIFHVESELVEDNA